MNIELCTYITVYIPPHGRANDAMAFAMSVNETAPLAFERSLNVGGARRYTRLQSCCDFVVMWFTWCRQAQTTDAKSLDPDYVTVVQFCHEQKELSLRN